MTGFVVWFTGLSGSGKSTLATLLAEKLAERGVHAEILDGDEIRRNLSKGLGFSREDRAENLRRLGFVATVVARTGSCAIAAAISPYRDVRDEIRGLCARFCEVYVECPLDVLTERDPKGLYKKALRGEIKNMTGVNDPYEAPTEPDVVVRTDRENPQQSVQLVLDRLQQLGFVDAHVDRKARPVLVRRVLAGAAATAAQLEARTLPVLRLSDERAAITTALGLGVLSPVTGFMTRRETHCVLGERRLEGGAPWTTPVLLPVPDALEDALKASKKAALFAPDGELFATLDVQELWRAETAGSELYAAGPVQLLRPLKSLPPPEQVADRIDQLGWSKIAAVDMAGMSLGKALAAARNALVSNDGVLLFAATASEEFQELAELDPKRALAIGLGESATLAGYRAITLHNYGATRWLVGAPPHEAERQLAERLGLEVVTVGTRGTV